MWASRCSLSCSTVATATVTPSLPSRPCLPGTSSTSSRSARAQRTGPWPCLAHTRTHNLTFAQPCLAVASPKPLHHRAFPLSCSALPPSPAVLAFILRFPPSWPRHAVAAPGAHVHRPHLLPWPHHHEPMPKAVQPGLTFTPARCRGPGGSRNPRANPRWPQGQVVALHGLALDPAVASVTQPYHVAALASQVPAHVGIS
jgi:hypothetical protein